MKMYSYFVYSKLFTLLVKTFKIQKFICSQGIPLIDIQYVSYIMYKMSFRNYFIKITPLH